MTTSTPTHPADTIADSTNFVEAVTRYIVACEYEAEKADNVSRRLSWIAAAAVGHGAIYLHNRLGPSDAFDVFVFYSPDYSHFATALESGDYSKLAF